MDFAWRTGQLLTLAGGNTSATLRAAAEGISGVNAAMAYGTDGAIAALGLVALADDKGAQIVYAPAPVVRAAVLRAIPADRRPARPGLRRPDPARHCSASTPRSRSMARMPGAVAAAYLKSRHPPP